MHQIFRKSEKRIAKLQKSHAKKQKDSKNKEKARILLAKKHRSIKRQRQDYLKKTAYSIVKNNDLICVEDLNIAGMLKNHKLAKSIADVGWGYFIAQLEWQCKKQGKNFVKIGRFFPSTKQCSACGAKQDMPLKERTYICGSCSFEMDRDFNACDNILVEGIRIFNTAGTAEIHACGVTSGAVSPLGPGSLIPLGGEVVH